jgi:hypothetical protein
MHGPKFIPYIYIYIVTVIPLCNVCAVVYLRARFVT